MSESKVAGMPENIWAYESRTKGIGTWYDEDVSGPAPAIRYVRYDSINKLLGHKNTADLAASQDRVNELDRLCDEKTSRLSKLAVGYVDLESSLAAMKAQRDRALKSLKWAIGGHGKNPFEIDPEDTEENLKEAQATIVACETGGQNEKE